MNFEEHPVYDIADAWPRQDSFCSVWWPVFFSVWSAFGQGGSDCALLSVVIGKRERIWQASLHQRFLHVASLHVLFFRKRAMVFSRCILTANCGCRVFIYFRCCECLACSLRTDYKMK